MRAPSSLPEQASAFPDPDDSEILDVASLRETMEDSQDASESADDLSESDSADQKGQEYQEEAVEADADDQEEQADEEATHLLIEEYTARLQTFQQQLAEIDQQLPEDQDDELLEECLERMKQVSDEFLTSTQETCERFDGSESDAKQASQQTVEAQERISEYSQQVQTHAAQWADWNASDLAETTEALKIASSKLAEEALRLMHELDEIVVAEPSETNIESESSESKEDSCFISADNAEKIIEDFYQSDPADQDLVAAFVQFDGMEDTDTSLSERILDSLGQLIDAELSEKHQATKLAAGKMLLLLSGEDLDGATRRLEHLRQQVEANEFLADGTRQPVTISCGIADARGAESRERLEAQLEEAICEAKRYGMNRTFCQEAGTAAPVVPPELHITPQEVLI